MTREQAEEYTQALGQVMGGGWRQVLLGQQLGVPRALGLTTPEWVQGPLGGYVRQSLKERRAAVKELTAKGGLALSTRDAAEILGISHQTVMRDRGPGPSGPDGESADEAEGGDDGPDGPPRLGPLMSSGRDAWYTPAHVVERAVAVLGAIDLDPCSNSHVVPMVAARRHFTKDDDGLAQPWSGRVYMNPPYGRGVEDWIAKLVGAHLGGDVEAAIALVPARTDTSWFRRLRAFPVCFVAGRLSFSGHPTAAPFPSAVSYLGDDLRAFVAAFGDIGDVYRRVD